MTFVQFVPLDFDISKKLPSPQFSYLLYRHQLFIVAIDLDTSNSIPAICTDQTGSYGFPISIQNRMYINLQIDLHNERRVFSLWLHLMPTFNRFWCCQLFENETGSHLIDTSMFRHYEMWKLSPIVAMSLSECTIIFSLFSLLSFNGRLS